MGSTSTMRVGGYGAVLGNGTLVATPRHVVFETSKIGLHELGGFVYVISPYLGEVCCAKILEVDSQNDIAILQVPWAGHPGFTLADAEDTFDAEEVLLTSFHQGTARGEQPKWTGPKVLRLPVESIITNRRLPAQIVVECGQNLDHGWSGCPVVSCNSRELLGFISKVTLSGSNLAFPSLRERSANPAMKSIASGPSSDAIRRLVTRADKTAALSSVPNVLDRPRDAETAQDRILKAFYLLLSKKGPLWKEVLEDLQGFVQLRPESSAGTMLLASCLAETQETDQAESVYRKCLELQPENTTGHVVLGEHFNKLGRHDEAMEQFQIAKRIDPSNSIVSIVLVQALMEQGYLERASKEAQNEIACHPKNAHAWALLSLVHAKGGKALDAIETMRRAAALRPEWLAYRIHLAKALVRQGIVEEAEMHLRDSIVIAPEDSLPYMFLASFLARHRPDLSKEARELVSRAMQLPNITKAEETRLRKLLDSLSE